MEKNDLLRNIQEAIRTEESASAIFLEHLQALTERVGIDDRIADQARDVLERLIKENKRHKTILEALQKRVQGDTRDDW